jgi:hypothetical protein
VSVSSRSATLAASWTDTPVTFEAGYNAQSGVPAISSPYQFTLTQDAYTLTVNSISPTSVFNSAGNVSVNFTSTASSYSVQWHDSNTGGNTVGNVQTFSGSGTKTMPYPSTTVARTLYLYNATTNTLLPNAVLSQTIPPEYVADIITMNGTNWTRHCPSGYHALTTFSEYTVGITFGGVTTDGVNIQVVTGWVTGFCLLPLKYTGTGAGGDRFDWCCWMHNGTWRVNSAWEDKDKTYDEEKKPYDKMDIYGLCKRN